MLRFLHEIFQLVCSGIFFLRERLEERSCNVVQASFELAILLPQFQVLTLQVYVTTSGPQQ